MRNNNLFKKEVPQCLWKVFRKVRHVVERNDQALTVLVRRSYDHHGHSCWWSRAARLTRFLGGSPHASFQMSGLAIASATRTLKTALKYASVVANYRGIGMDHRITHSQHSHIEQIRQATKHFTFVFRHSFFFACCSTWYILPHIEGSNIIPHVAICGKMASPCLEDFKCTFRRQLWPLPNREAKLLIAVWLQFVSLQNPARQQTCKYTLLPFQLAVLVSGICYRLLIVSNKA